MHEYERGMLSGIGLTLGLLIAGEIAVYVFQRNYKFPDREPPVEFMFPNELYRNFPENLFRNIPESFQSPLEGMPRWDYFRIPVNTNKEPNLV